MGKYLVTKWTEETPKSTCTGNQPWAARFAENIFDTRETEDKLWKTTCAEHSEVAQFVENIATAEALCWTVVPLVYSSTLIEN